MKNCAFLATCLLSSSLMQATLIRSQAEPVYPDPAPGAIMPQIDWNSVSGVLWAQRNVSTYVLSTPGAALGLRAYSTEQQGYIHDTALAIASGSYNLVSTSNSSQTVGNTSGSSPGLGLFTSDDGPGTSYWSPGGLLAEWNPLPVVAVVNRGTSADDYPRDFSPGGLLVGFADDSAFTPPHLLLAGGSHAPPATLSPLGVARIGVSPEAFGGAPTTIRNMSASATVPTPMAQTSMIGTAVPMILSSPVVVALPPAQPRTQTQNEAPSQTQPQGQPTGVTPAPQLEQPVSSTAPITIATVAEAFMTTTVTDTTLAPARYSSALLARSNSTNLTTGTPEPGSVAALGLGLGFIFWKLRNRK